MGPFPDQNGIEVLLAILLFISNLQGGGAAILKVILQPTDPGRMETVIVLLPIVLSFVYFVVSWARSGQTIGNALTGI